MDYVNNFQELITVTRTRLTLRSVETYFLLMSVFATLGMIFKIFADMGPLYGKNLQLYQLFAVLGSIFLALAIGGLIFFSAMLSIYFDNLYRLERDAIYSSNFTFTRLVTPIARAAILLISLTLFLYSLVAF